MAWFKAYVWDLVSAQLRIPKWLLSKRVPPNQYRQGYATLATLAMQCNVKM